MEVKDGKCVVSFEKEGAEGLRLDKDVDVGFYIAGEDQIFHHARAKADSGEVTVWSDTEKDPVAVRYAFSNLPIGGLMNGLELPAYPFRSDNWPIKPHHSEGEYMRSHIDNE
jgi:sialate O-acetylesterase